MNSGCASPGVLGYCVQQEMLLILGDDIRDFNLYVQNFIPYSPNIQVSEWFVIGRMPI